MDASHHRPLRNAPEGERHLDPLGTALTPDALTVLEAMRDAWARNEDAPFVTYRLLQARTGLKRDDLREAVAILRCRGFAELKFPLYTEDGQVAGAGHAITGAGLSWLCDTAGRAR